MTADLLTPLLPPVERIRPGMVVLRRFADPAVLVPTVDGIAARAAFRRMSTPGGQSMSVAMTNCGALGWITDRRGYRYAAEDPLTGQPWPMMPDAFAELAHAAADAGGFPGFRPDACLINRYIPGARMTAHQDRDEADFSQPIVSVSLGLPATFFVHEGEQRAGRAVGVKLASGDVVVWGGPARLAFHGVRDLKTGTESIAGPVRYNLTFRRAG